eukprot:jgi/Chlat1/8619/Chrsp86S08008
MATAASAATATPAASLYASTSSSHKPTVRHPRKCSLALLPKSSPYVSIWLRRRLSAGRSHLLIVRANNDNEGEGAAQSGKDKDDGALPPALGEDWRAFRARMIATEETAAKHSSEPASPVTRKAKQSGAWAHPIAQVEKGCLLLAHEGLRGLFWQTVILILEHDDRTGTMGLVLNRPSPMKFGQLSQGAGLSEHFRQRFGAEPFYLGGPVRPNMVLSVHGRGDVVRGSTKVMEGVFVGHPEHAEEAVTANAAATSEFKFFFGHAGWAPGQLATEIALGNWYIAAACSSLATQHCLSLPRPLWRQVLDLMGGSHAQVAARLDQEDHGQYLGME